MYHVTGEKEARSILNQGFKPRNTPPTYYSPRYELDAAADTIGARIHDRWVPRTNGVYFWNSVEEARNNTQELAEYDTLIEVDASRVNSDIWVASNNRWEELYRKSDRPYNLTPEDDIWTDIKQFVQSAKLHPNGGGNELWTRPHVRPDAIVDTYQM